MDVLDLLASGFEDSTSLAKDLSTLMRGGKGPLNLWPSSLFQKSHVMFGLECMLPVDDPKGVVYLDGTKSWLTAEQPDGGLVIPRCM